MIKIYFLRVINNFQLRITISFYYHVNVNYVGTMVHRLLTNYLYI